MSKKKANQYIKPTADKLKLREDLVFDIVYYYYTKLREELSSMNNICIEVEGLGKFNVKRNELQKMIIKCVNQINKMDPDTMSRMKLMLDVKRKLVIAQQLQKKLDEEYARKKEHLIKKKNGFTEDLDK